MFCEKIHIIIPSRMQYRINCTEETKIEKEKKKIEENKMKKEQEYNSELARTRIDVQTLCNVALKK